MTIATAEEAEQRARTRLGYWVVGLSIVSVAGISAVAIVFATNDGRPEMARLVFTAVLPLLGTWVGTVLAFYFARENLQAATASTISTLKFAGGLPSDTPVTDVMLRADKIDPRRDEASRADAGAIPLKDLYDAMKAKGRSRVPIFDASGSALYVIHEPDIDKYAQIKQTTSSTLPDRETVATLLAQGDPLKAAVETFVAVPADATVADARAQLRTKPECKDVFVTAGGKETDRVLGWLTNSDLARTP